MKTQSQFASKSKNREHRRDSIELKLMKRKCTQEYLFFIYKKPDKKKQTNKQTNETKMKSNGKPKF